MTNIRGHSADASESLRFGNNDYNLDENQAMLLDRIMKDLDVDNVVGYKLTVAIDNSFNVSGNTKYPYFYYLEKLGK